MVLTRPPAFADLGGTDSRPVSPQHSEYNTLKFSNNEEEPAFDGTEIRVLRVGAASSAIGRPARRWILIIVRPGRARGGGSGAIVNKQDDPFCKSYLIRPRNIESTRPVSLVVKFTRPDRVPRERPRTWSLDDEHPACSHGFQDMGPSPEMGSA